MLHHEDMWPHNSFEHDSQVEVETRIEGRHEKERMPRRSRVYHVRSADERTTDMTIEKKFVTDVSDWDRLTRHVTRWRRILQPKADRPTARAISAEELKYAQLALFFLCQTEFRDDLDTCRYTFVNLAPVRDAKGMIRAEGCLGKLPLQPSYHPSWK